RVASVADDVGAAARSTPHCRTGGATLRRRRNGRGFCQLRAAAVLGPDERRRRTGAERNGIGPEWSALAKRPGALGGLVRESVATENSGARFDSTRLAARKHGGRPGGVKVDRQRNGFRSRARRFDGGSRPGG